MNCQSDGNAGKGIYPKCLEMHTAILRTLDVQVVMRHSQQQPEGTGMSVRLLTGIQHCCAAGTWGWKLNAGKMGSLLALLGVLTVGGGRG